MFFKTTPNFCYLSPCYSRVTPKLKEFRLPTGTQSQLFGTKSNARLTGSSERDSRW
jgi:hypothetical protein